MNNDQGAVYVVKGRRILAATGTKVRDESIIIIEEDEQYRSNDQGDATDTERSPTLK